MRRNPKGKRIFKTAFLILMISLTVAPFASAGNITIWDKMGSGSSWNGVQEDQEVEPGNISTQAWDLEGFFLNNSQLTMIGGFDLKNGVTYSNYTYKSGDIFIDTNGDAKYGPGTPGSPGSEDNLNETFGYYGLTVDLGFLNPGTTFISHFTMECGNDDLN